MIVLIVLFVLLTVAAIVQITIASRDTPSFPGPTSPGQLPVRSSSTPAP